MKHFTVKIHQRRHSGESRNPETVKANDENPAGSISAIRSGFRINPGMTAKSRFYGWSEGVIHI